MANSPLSPVLDQLRRVALLPDGAGLTDGELLESFISRKDGSAFEALVRRHGPMVLGVCRRVLSNHHDAEDAFQAAFLVLARKADSIMPREHVVNWLYGVAYRTALKARTMAATHSARARQVTEMPEPEAVEPDNGWRELQPLLDQELSRLPDKYRLPVILCDLEGKSGKEAARRLGCPEGTVASRLSRGRTLLRGRLARRGLVVTSSGSLAVWLSQNAAAAMPPSLVIPTVQAAALVAAGEAATGVISDRVADLAERVIEAMFSSYLNKTTIGFLLAAALCVTGGGWLYWTPAAARAPRPAALLAPQPKPKSAWELRNTLRGHTGAVSAVALSPGGKLLASASFDKTIKLWETATGKLKTTLNGHSDRVFSVTFAPDGKTLASASADGTARICDVVTGKERLRLQGHTS
jgi:RNA polymerase sigma factor (sigma-70 family)